ncbi:MAG TPA: amidohydrolase family protein [Stellaceae bacterium]|jgi:2,3-dihydroxybenzoate decarboxylase|nr:amidohydrolase family protein [Stellaceae bacterium]
MIQNHPVIALEEHYWHSEVVKKSGGDAGAHRGPDIVTRLNEIGPMRIATMDEAGIDIQILGHGMPATQRMDAESAVRLARISNDYVAEKCKAYPTRLYGFANLPTPDPKAAADELERTVTKLGFKGAMVHGPSNDVFLDDERFWPMWERAAALEVPIYMHPATIDTRVSDIYLKDYLKKWPQLVGASWGFTIETATIGLRMVLSGVFERYPKLQIILGHMGEALPFLIHRETETLRKITADGKTFRDIFCNNFYITTSGYYSTPALNFSITEMGIDRIMFSVDYPYVDSKAGTDWMAGVQMSAVDKGKILSGNAKRLMRM